MNYGMSHRKDDLESDLCNRYIPAARLHILSVLLRMTIWKKTYLHSAQRAETDHASEVTLDRIGFIRTGPSPEIIIVPTSTLLVTIDCRDHDSYAYVDYIFYDGELPAGLYFVDTAVGE